MMYTVRKYNSVDALVWNSFISQAKNGTFLFHRDFMEYHADRFQDYSLLIMEKGNLVAVLPANIAGDTLFSHQGLTYGSLIYGEKVKLATVVQIFKALLTFLYGTGVRKLHLKLIPSIYHRSPAEELSYALFLTKANLVRRDSLAVIANENPLKLSKDRKDGVKRGIKNGLTILEETTFELFWNKVLIPNLSRKHNAAPVHTLKEIIKLHEIFPNNIRQFNVYKGDEIVAGATFFVTDTVAHSQYTSALADKNETGSLDFLFHHLIENVFAEKKYFDFGISNEEQGRKLNGGLSYWKESFGARAFVQDFYEVETQNFDLLEDFLI